MLFVNVVTIKPVDRSYEDDEGGMTEIGSNPKNDVEEEMEEVEDYFNKFPTEEELAYHKNLLDDPNPSIYRNLPIIRAGNPNLINIPCNILAFACMESLY